MKLYYLIFLIISLSTAIGVTSCDKLVKPDEPEPKVETYLGYAVGDSGKIYKSVDKGNTWSFRQSGTITKLNSVLAVNENIAFAVGNDGLILKTTNGGNSWDIQPSGTSVNLRKIKFNYLMNQVWITGEQGVLLVSNGY